MTEPDAPDDSLLGDRLRHGLETPGYLPLPSAGPYGRLIALGRLRGRGPTDIARAVLRALRRRARPPAPAPGVPQALEPAGLSADLALRRGLEQMTLHARSRRLAGLDARPIARLLAPARMLGHRVLAPTFEAQESFNDAALATVERLSALVIAQQERIAELEDRLGEA